MKIVQIDGTYGGGRPGAANEYVHKKIIECRNNSHVFQIESDVRYPGVIKEMSLLFFVIY